MSEIKGNSRDMEAMRATARLPGLDIEIAHRWLPEGNAEQVSINLTASPSFEAFRVFLEAANPLAFWAGAMRLAWLPWLEAARAVMRTPDLAPSLPEARPRTASPSDIS